MITTTSTNSVTTITACTNIITTTSTSYVTTITACTNIITIVDILRRIVEMSC